MTTKSIAISSNIFSSAAHENWNASTRVYNHLRQRILSLDLPPGESLLRSELAKTYSVSVTPIRDALKILEQNGLVRVFPQSRTLVTCINEPLIHEALFLRKALETEVVKQLSRQCSEETLDKLHEIINVQKAVAQQSDQLRLFQEIDEQFHFVLFEGAGQSNLYELIRSKSGHLDRVRRLQKHSTSKLEQIIRGHVNIVEALEAQDELAAIKAMRDHLRKPADWVDEFRQKYGDFFD
nr:GntR family transcriptional regulator [uncultured Cohaesibacter sp.]